MKYTNTIYLKSGITINQESDQNLANEIRHVVDWDRSSITLENRNTVTIPRERIDFIDTKLNEVRNG